MMILEQFLWCQPKADTHCIVPRRVEGWDDLPAHTRSPIKLPTEPGVEG